MIIPEPNDPCPGCAYLGDVNIGAREAVEGRQAGVHVYAMLQGLSAHDCVCPPI